MLGVRTPSLALDDGRDLRDLLWEAGEDGLGRHCLSQLCPGIREECRVRRRVVHQPVIGADGGDRPRGRQRADGRALQVVVDAA